MAFFVLEAFVCKWLIILVFLVTPSLAWGEPFTSATGRFSVQARGALAESAQVNETPLGQVQEHIFRWTQGPLEWVVNYSDVPEVATALGGSPLLVQVRQGFQKTTGLPVRRETTLTMAGHRARSFEFSILPSTDRPRRTGLARVFLAGRRLYVITTTWDLPELPADRSEAEGFFDSFTLTK